MDIRDKNGFTEEEYLAQYNPDKYVKPSVSVDMVVLGINKDYTGIKILLIKRGAHPYIDHWALPGGFVKPDESTAEAAARELKQETGLKDVYLEEIHTFSSPDRDPRMRIISDAYLALVPELAIVRGDDDASDAAWFDIQFNDDELVIYNQDRNIEIKYSIKHRRGKNGRIHVDKRIIKSTSAKMLAFDHEQIIVDTMTKMRKGIMYSNLPFCMANEEFTLPDLQIIYELLVGHPLYKANFRQGVADRIEATGNRAKSIGGRRLSELYRLKD